MFYNKIAMIHRLTVVPTIDLKLWLQAISLFNPNLWTKSYSISSGRIIKYKCSENVKPNYRRDVEQKFIS